MKVFSKLTVAFVLITLLALLLPASVANADEIVTFPDKNLEGAIRQAIKKPIGDILQSDLARLTSLTAQGREIEVLSGLGNCTNLTGLYLGSNKIRDLSPLYWLDNLTSLRLDSNQIDDIDWLWRQTGLTQLYLSNNQIEKISGLRDMEKLYLLDLGSNKIRDISHLKRLTKLWWLNLGDNQISGDIYDLDGLTKLTSLNLSKNRIDDIGGLSPLTRLLSLNLSDNQISDVLPLVKNEGLGKDTHIDLRTNPLDSDSLYEYIPQLQKRKVEVLYDRPPLNTPVGLNVTVTFPHAVVTFINITVAGTTTCTTSTGNPGGPLPPNFRVKSLFIDIPTTATYTGPVTVGIPYDPSEPNPKNLKLFHWEGGHWQDVTTTVDTVKHIVYGEVSSFSWFFIGGEWVWVPSVPVFPSVYIGIGAALGVGILAYFVRRKLVHQEQHTESIKG
jgi:Leucine-rich repeat (LRR) protein